MKNLNLKIENCAQCPYLRESESQGIIGHPYDFYCGHQSIITQKQQVKPNRIAQFCPIPTEPFYVRVGVAVFLVNKKDQLFLGKRKSLLGQGCWGLAGGKPEMGEDLIAAAARETKEETNLTIFNLKPLDWTNDIFPMLDQHYVTLYYICRDFSGEYKNMEPNKCEGFQWFDLDNLPAPLFLPLDTLIVKHYDRLIEKIKETKNG